MKPADEEVRFPLYFGNYPLTKCRSSKPQPGWPGRLRWQEVIMSSSKQTAISEEQARRIGQGGGTVNTNGMPSQTAKRIDAAVIAGQKGK